MTGNIRLVIAGQSATPEAVEDGESINDFVLRKGVVYPKGYAVSVNGKSVDHDTVLMDGDSLTIHQSQEGNF